MGCVGRAAHIRAGAAQPATVRDDPRVQCYALPKALQVCWCWSRARRRDMCVRARASVCACALLLALVIAEDDKRAEMSPMPFLMATRYGRSSPPARLERKDRFMMYTRYGKRSEALAGASASEGSLMRGVAGERGAGGALLCQFTGVFPLYRCRRKPPQHHKRSAEEIRED
ncbi:hypothetical protein PYW07_011594 [Mythimna separata]|uniref:Uncharacterized protein n=1 Tax=Mythimna separata TaxID=271217 RepID=A0AAD7Y6G6_MYTSE|nr:hypothetical protein PYW07_011594 [Mythimna separata]